MTAEQIASRLDVGCSGNPVDRATGALEAVLTDTPRAETTAIILADVVLARALGWDHVLPLLAAGLRPLDLRKKGVDLQRACHQAIVIAADVAVGMAADLAHRGQALRAAAPKLRAEGSGLLSDRAARRLCNRLVALGVLRELTGRDSFRLYGV